MGKSCRDWHWGDAVPLSHLAPSGIIPCVPFPSHLPVLLYHPWMHPKTSFPKGSKQLESRERQRNKPQGPHRGLRAPKRHVASMPHLGGDASFVVLSHGEHPAFKLLMLSLAKAEKPQIALETSCCDGCTYFSWLPKNRAWCGEPQPCQTSPCNLSHSERDREHPIYPPTLSQAPKAAPRGVGACDHQSCSETLWG